MFGSGISFPKPGGFLSKSRTKEGNTSGTFRPSARCLPTWGMVSSREPICRVFPFGRVFPLEGLGPQRRLLFLTFSGGFRCSNGVLVNNILCIDQKITNILCLS